MDLENKIIFLRINYGLSQGGDLLIDIEENERYFDRNFGLSFKEYNSLLNSLSKKKYFEIIKKDKVRFIGSYNSKKIKEIFSNENYDDNSYEEDDLED